MSESMSPPPRELAQRRSGSDEILLLWYPESERVEVTVCDVETGAGFQLEVAPGSAIDAFYHPYAYATSRTDLLERALEVADDGRR
jgi:hypothetical protein